MKRTLDTGPPATTSARLHGFRLASAGACARAAALASARASARGGPLPALSLALALALSGALSVTPRPARAQPAATAAQDPAQLERRVQSVATLIETSSAARQIEASGDAAAREKRDSARLIHREAVVTLKAGDTAGAARLLDQATREMMSGARLAKPEQVAGEKARRDFDARLESARALQGAQQRIAAEKGRDPAALQAARDIAALIDAAEQQAGQGRLAEARPLLDRAYLTARVSIEGLRRGDTLVRSLTFANAQEEYVYEVDRYQTHRMLIQVLVSDRGTSPALLQGFVDRAAALRTEADARAQRGDHAGAVKGLEDATRELVRAIRAAGLYIPG